MAFRPVRTPFLNVPEKLQRNMQNPVSQHAASCGRCFVGHIAGKGVTWRRVALTKKHGKTQKMRGGEGKILENCGKKGETGEGKRGKCEKRWKEGEKMEKRERGRRKEEEKERRKGWAAGLLHDTANVVGIMPAMSRPPLHKKRTCSKPLRKNSKNAGKTRKLQIWAERTLVRHHKPTKMAPPLAKKAKGAHHCPKKIAKLPQKHGKHDKLLSKIDQKRVLIRRKVWAIKN